MFYFYSYWILIVFSILFILAYIEQKIRAFLWIENGYDSVSLYHFRQNDKKIKFYERGNIAFLSSYLLSLLSFFGLQIMPKQGNTLLLVAGVVLPFLYRAMGMLISLKDGIHRDERFFFKKIFGKIEVGITTIWMLIHLALGYFSLDILSKWLSSQYQGEVHSVNLYIVSLLSLLLYLLLLNFMDEGLKKSRKKDK